MTGLDVSLTSVTARYRRRGAPALDAADLAWAPGLVHGLLGRNGSGKSTLSPAAAARLTDRFELPRRSFVDRLSRGQRSALGVVLGLASRAPLTLLDEVTLGLDAAGRAGFACELALEQAEHPRTVVVATHLVDEVEPLLDRVTVLHAGRVLLHDDVEAVRSRVVAVSGPAPTVEGFAVGREVITSRRLGGTAEVVGADPAGQSRLTAAPRGSTPLASAGAGR